MLKVRYFKLLSLCIVVIIVYCTVWMYSKDTNWKLNIEQPDKIQDFPHERWKTSTRNFVYSEEKLFQTILDIRRKNCRLGNSVNTGLCLSRDTCNKATVKKKPSLPSCKRRLQRGIIVGVAKAGTREVIDFLMMHPQIVIKKEPKYEISFFSDKWDRGLGWYKHEMPFSLPDQVTIEKSPNYFSHPTAPARIRKSIPNVKLILIVRDPVDRIISHITFHNSFEKSRDLLERYINDSANSSMISYSTYDVAFERYLHHFDRSHILVLDSERFKRDPYSVLKDIETHLGLPHVIKKTDFEFNGESGFFCLRSVKHTSAVCFGQNRGRSNVSRSYIEYQPRLGRIFRPHNERFFELVGHRFDWK